MNLTLQRESYEADYTKGELSVNGVPECVTLERPKADPVHPCIPAGRYRLIISPSPRLQRDLPRLLKVPGRDGILIHPFNYVRESEGCIGPGMDFVPAHGDIPAMITSSRVAFDMLFYKLKLAPDEIWIDVLGPVVSE